jgi:hypothetical protein
MPVFKETYLDHQLKRAMRPDAHRFVRPDWRRFVRKGGDISALFELYEHKYRPDQTRDDQGRWTSEGGRSEGKTPPASDPSVENGRVSQRVAQDCELLARLDRFTCQAVRTRSCWAQANFRYSQCLIGGYIPPIYH